MKLSEWRAKRQEGEEATLPSGLEIRVKRVSVVDLAEQGKIPQTLQPKLEEFMSGGGASNVNLEEFSQYTEMINLVCTACIVEPADLDVKELPFEDRLAILNWANAMTADLRLFRDGQNGVMAVGPAGPEVRTETQ